MKIITIGSAVHDLFIEYENPQLMAFEIDGQEVMYITLEEGRKHEIKELHHATGGGALNSACSFKRLDFSVAPCSKIGTDNQGEFILKQLAQKKIDTVYITKSSKTATGTSYILLSPTGNSALLVNRAANLTLSKKDIPLKDFIDCDQLYITSLSKNSSELLPYITKQAKKLGIPVAVNPGTSQLTVNVTTLIESLADIDILILNTFEASLLAEKFLPKRTKVNKKPNHALPELLATHIVLQGPLFTLQEYFQEIHAQGPSIAAVTNGEDGVYISDGSHIYYHPSLPIEVTSTVGAGDAFGSTFVAQLLKGKSLEQAIRAGVINSAAVLEHLDATTGLLDQKELDELVAEIDQNGIKKFDV